MIVDLQPLQSGQAGETPPVPDKDRSSDAGHPFLALIGQQQMLPESGKDPAQTAISVVQEEVPTKTILVPPFFSAFPPFSGFETVNPVAAAISPVPDPALPVVEETKPALPDEIAATPFVALTIVPDAVPQSDIGGAEAFGAAVSPDSENPVPGVLFQEPAVTMAEEGATQEKPDVNPSVYESADAGPQLDDGSADESAEMSEVDRRPMRGKPETATNHGPRVQVRGGSPFAGATQMVEQFTQDTQTIGGLPGESHRVRLSNQRPRPVSGSSMSRDVISENVSGSDGRAGNQDDSIDTTIRDDRGDGRARFDGPRVFDSAASYPGIRMAIHSPLPEIHDGEVFQSGSQPGHDAADGISNALPDGKKETPAGGALRGQTNPAIPPAREAIRPAAIQGQKYVEPVPAEKAVHAPDRYAGAKEDSMTDASLPDRKGDSGGESFAHNRSSNRISGEGEFSSPGFEASRVLKRISRGDPAGTTVQEAMLPLAGKTPPNTSPRIPQPASQMQDSDFLLHLVERFESQVRAGEGTLRIQLKPSVLGRIEIKAESTAGALTATIVAESGKVKDYLEQNLPILHRALQDHGLKVDRVNITVYQGNWNQNPAGHHASHQSWSGGQEAHPGSRDWRRETPGASVEEIVVDPQTLSALGPNSTFHTVA